MSANKGDRSLGSATDFDQFAENYDEVLSRAISVSGHNKHYFAQNRVSWLGRWLERLEVKPVRVLDYGCGTGTAIPWLCNSLSAARVIGVDVSQASLAIAEREHGALPVDFSLCADHVPGRDIDVAYCNGVFHHIPMPERKEAAALVFHSLRPGGVFGFWENNPWNVGARYCMRVNPFDRDAAALTARQACALLESVGFRILATNYLFIFPKPLAWLRWLEPLLCRIPLGAQYMVLCQRPLSPSRPATQDCESCITDVPTAT